MAGNQVARVRLTFRGQHRAPRAHHGRACLLSTVGLCVPVRPAADAKGRRVHVPGHFGSGTGVPADLVFAGGREPAPTNTKGRLKLGGSHKLHVNFQLQRGQHPEPMLFGGPPYTDERLDEEGIQF